MEWRHLRHNQTTEDSSPAKSWRLIPKETLLYGEVRALSKVLAWREERRDPKLHRRSSRRVLPPKQNAAGEGDVSGGGAW